MPKMPLLLLFIFFSFLGCSVQDKEAVADPYIWDFGRVKEGEAVKHSFTLKNETAKTMKIKDLTTSCGCTVSKAKNKTLKAGESTQIEVVFDSKGYKGEIKQFVFVSTDSLDNPAIQFIIKANVE